eukprot:COSAG04_NODE_5948_length_1449_cov_1.091852_1_plen_110_part_00
MRPIDPAEARAAFDLGDPAEHLYINAAGRSPLLRASHAAATAALASKLRPWAFPDADAGRAKELFGEILGCGAADVAVTPSAAYAIRCACPARPCCCLCPACCPALSLR